MARSLHNIHSWAHVGLADCLLAVSGRLGAGKPLYFRALVGVKHRLQPFTPLAQFLHRALHVSHRSQQLIGVGR